MLKGTGEVSDPGSAAPENEEAVEEEEELSSMNFKSLAPVASTDEIEQVSGWSTLKWFSYVEGDNREGQEYPLGGEGS